MVLSEKMIPSAVTKLLKFGISHFWVDLTIFEEPARVEGVRIRVHRFIVKHRPFHRRSTTVRQPAEFLRTMCC
jgi:hypothetical protein